MTSYYENSSTKMWKILFLGIFLLCAYKLIEHTLKHGLETRNEINSICDSGGVLKRLVNPAGRTAEICKNSEGKFGIRIIEGDKVLSNFWKDSAKFLNDVTKYLWENGRYTTPK